MAGIGPAVFYARKIGKINPAANVKWLPELNVDKGLKGGYVRLKVGSTVQGKARGQP